MVAGHGVPQIDLLVARDGLPLGKAGEQEGAHPVVGGVQADVSGALPCVTHQLAHIVRQGELLD
jgi:hypothetical protein